MTTLPEEVHPEPGHYADRADVGYKHTLSNLQIQLIAIGGAIGVGLFLGTGARLQAVGPGLVFSYLAVGVLVYFMMRALGEMVIYRPTTGAMVSYSREFVGNRFAHLTGWIYVTLAAIAGVVEIAALAVYVEFWLPDLPGWVPSLIALLIIVGSNLFTVHAFGNIEVGATLIKVTAILLFLVAGIIIVVLTAFGALDTQASVSNCGPMGFSLTGCGQRSLLCRAWCSHTRQPKSWASLPVRQRIRRK